MKYAAQLSSRVFIKQETVEKKNVAELDKCCLMKPGLIWGIQCHERLTLTTYRLLNLTQIPRAVSLMISGGHLHPTVRVYVDATSLVLMRW